MNKDIQLFDYKSGNSFVTLVKLLENQYTQDVYGAFIFSIEESVFYDIYKSAPSPGGFIYIVDSNGRILSDSRRELTGTSLQKDELGELISHMNPNSGYGSFEENNHIVMVKKIDKADWYVVYSNPIWANAKIVTSLKAEIVLIALACFLVSVVVALLTARYFSKPLILLTKKVSRHLTSVPMYENKPTGITEVDLLTIEYELLIDKLESSIQLLVREQEEKRKSEILALQMQINPHFLYNTFKFAEMLSMDRADRVDRACIECACQAVPANDQQKRRHHSAAG